VTKPRDEGWSSSEESTSIAEHAWAERMNRTLYILFASLLVSCATLSGCDDTKSNTNDDTCTGANCVLDTSVQDGTGDTTTDVKPDTVPDVETELPMDVTVDVDGEDVDDTANVEVEETVETDVADDTDVPVGCGYGSIKGRVCSPNGSDWLSDVEVSISGFDCDGNAIVIQDFTDANGFYYLDNVPTGQHSITIKTGSYTTSVDNVRVDAGKETDLTGTLTKTCLDRRAASIAVLTGTFDHIEQILDQLGVTYQLYEGDSAALNPNSARSGLDLLKNLNELLTYDILFINCGEWYQSFNLSTQAEVDLMEANLVTFVQSGGSLYVSGWAYYWAELAFPEAVDYYGDDLFEGSAKKGNIIDNLVADVISTPFQNALAPATTLTIKFNWPAWVVASSVSFTSTVHILAASVPTFSETLTDVPLVVSHKPTETSGTVFFTSFHHEAQLSGQMEQVLRFLVFQL